MIRVTDKKVFQALNDKKIYCILLTNEDRQVELGDKVLMYKKNLIKNQVQNSNLKIEFIKEKNLLNYQLTKKTLMLFILRLEKICLF